MGLSLIFLLVSWLFASHEACSLCMMATSAHLRNGSTKIMYLSVHDEFQYESFNAQRLTHKFCRLTLDHSHEQSNK